MLSGFSVDKESGIGITFNPGCTQRINEKINMDLYEIEHRALQPNNIEFNVPSPGQINSREKEVDCRRSSSMKATAMR